MKKNSVKDLKRELYDAYCDIINIVENCNIDKKYIESSYKNVVLKCKEMDK